MSRHAMIVNAGWHSGISGVATFLRIVVPDWQRRHDLILIEAPAPPPGAARRSVLTKLQARTGSLRLLGGYLRQFMRDYRFAWQQRRVIGARKIILNSYGCETLPIAFRLAFPRNRLVLISHTHPGNNAAAHHPLRRWIERMCAAAANFVVFNSRENRRLWQEKLDRPVRRAVMIHHGLPPPDETLPRDYPPKPDGVLDFVYVAQFSAGKGQTEFLDAWALALKNHGLPDVDRRVSTGIDGCRHGSANIRLIFVGDGVRRAAAEARAAELGVTDSVVFLGAQPDGARCFNGADVAVLMSQGAEAFGFVLLEAMSRGKPTLAARIGGIPEVVADGESGLLVDPRDTEAVAEAIVRLARDAGLRERLGAAGKQRWRECFSVERMLREYDKVLAME